MFPIDAIYIDEPNKINGDNYVGGKVDPVKEDECSGGYDCKPTGDYENDYSYPEDAPLPDNTSKIPKKCNVPTKNTGKENNDPFVELNEQEVTSLKTKSWNTEVNYFLQNPISNELSQKPRIIEPKL
jgi:hypothetical protein